MGFPQTLFSFALGRILEMLLTAVTLSSDCPALAYLAGTLSRKSSWEHSQSKIYHNSRKPQ